MRAEMRSTMVGVFELGEHAQHLQHPPRCRAGVERLRRRAQHDVEARRPQRQAALVGLRVVHEASDPGQTQVRLGRGRRNPAEWREPLPEPGRVAPPAAAERERRVDATEIAPDGQLGQSPWWLGGVEAVPDRRERTRGSQLACGGGGADPRKITAAGAGFTVPEHFDPPSRPRFSPMSALICAYGRAVSAAMAASAHRWMIL
jgi:hypothetical protein